MDHELMAVLLRTNRVLAAFLFLFNLERARRVRDGRVDFYLN